MIETTTLVVLADPTNTAAETAVQTTTNAATTTPVAAELFDTGITQPGSAHMFQTLNARAYSDPSQVIRCFANTKGTNPIVGLSMSCTLTGYLVSLP